MHLCIIYPFPVYYLYIYYYNVRSLLLDTKQFICSYATGLSIVWLCLCVCVVYSVYGCGYFLQATRTRVVWWVGCGMAVVYSVQQ
jgi:hypothetical protein